jgi:uncharacterized protein
MQTYTISRDISQPTDIQISDKAACVGRLFGMNRQQIKKRTTKYRTEIDVHSGDIIYITGASGAGKSVVLNELQKAVPADQKVVLDQVTVPADKTVIDCIDAPTVASLQILSSAGLAETLCILNTPANLSEGERYRFRLALALATKKQYIFADEFCSSLDRISASVISWRIRDYAHKTGTIFVLASAHEDILLDLQPDCIVLIDLNGNIELHYKKRKVRSA